MNRIALTADEAASLAFVRLGELVQAYRAGSVADLQERMKRLSALLATVAALNPEDLKKPREAKKPARKGEFRLEADELRTLVHARLTDLRRDFVNETPGEIRNRLERIIELHGDLVTQRKAA